MRVLIDTNIILDWLMCREPFQANAKYILEQSLFGELEGYISAHSLTDLFYILRKDFDVKKRKELLLLLCENLKVISEVQETFVKALKCEEWDDLEDGLQMQCAADEELDYIVTRNLKDFKHSAIMPVLPEQLIAIYRADKSDN